MSGLFLCVLICGCVTIAGAVGADESLPGADRPLSARFADPPAESRIIKIIHGWPDEPSKQDTLIGRLAEQGFGGVVCNVSFSDYLVSEEKWNSFGRAVREAKKKGMSLWLYDERGYPSGAAGELVLKDHPELEAEGLLVAEKVAEGGEIRIDLPPGVLFSASADPVADGKIEVDRAIDLSSFVKDRALTWNAPRGRWHVMVITRGRLYEGTHVSVSLGDRCPYVNILLPEVTERFLEVTHDNYAKHLGQDLSGSFVSTFTDEPSLMAYFFHPMPYKPLPWSSGFAEEFRKRRGYAVEPLIPLLVADAGARSARARYDYWKTVSELVSENYFGKIEDWCRRHKLLSGGHALLEEDFSAQVPLYGDMFRCLRQLSAPSMDCLTSIPKHVPWVTARLIESAADLENRSVTMSETSDHVQRYRPKGDERPPDAVSEDEIRGTCNALMLNGINTLTSYYSFAGLSDAQLRRLNTWVGRCCTMLKGGRHVSEVAVVHPVESIWPGFVPSTDGTSSARDAHRIEAAFYDVSNALYASNRDFNYIDSDVLVHATVSGDTLAYRGMAWRVVVLPAVDTLPIAAWEKLAEFVKAGGVAVACGALPANSESEFPSRKVKAISDTVFGKVDGAYAKASAKGGVGVFIPPGMGVALPRVLDGVLGRDVTIDGSESPIRAVHRRIDGHEVYFLANSSSAEWTGCVSLAARGGGEKWDPASGERVEVASGRNIQLSLPAYGAVFFRFAQAESTKRKAIKTGLLQGVKLSPLPKATVSYTCDESVKSELKEDEAGSALDAPAWRLSSTLTKGNKDTYAFMSFSYPESLDLSRVSCVAVDTWVPSKQDAGMSMSVILRDENGTTGIAKLTRILCQPGRYTDYVPLHRFEPLSAPNGRGLDLKRITSISVGWGGYYGTEGERATFSACPPRVWK